MTCSAFAGVELARHLVREQQVGLVRKGHRHRDALRLAPRHAARQMVETATEAQLREELPGPRCGPPAAPELDGELHVLRRGEEGDQVAALEHDPDAPGASRASGVVEVGDVLPVEDDPSRLGHHQPGDEAEQGRLPAARHPDEAGRLTGRELQAGGVQDA